MDWPLPVFESRVRLVPGSQTTVENELIPYPLLPPAHFIGVSPEVTPRQKFSHDCEVLHSICTFSALGDIGGCLGILSASSNVFRLALYLNSCG